MKGLLTFLAKRYIAGTDRRDAIEAARSLNSLGIAAAIDHLGENVTSAEEAQRTVEGYLSLLDDINTYGVNANISLKLTHLGLDISKELTVKNAETIVTKALSCNNFVRFDMESSAYTERTIDICLKLRSRFPNVGVAIQSSLKRSAADVKTLIDSKVSVRLVKGAYKEPPEIAFEDKKDVDASYEALMKELLFKGSVPAIATHDERLIDEAIGFVREKNIPKDSFEFEMLLGIKRTFQKRLAEEGFRVRVYVPYGKDWLPYTLRRLRERKENVFFVLKNIFD